MDERPIEDIIAGDKFRETLLPRADANRGGAPLFHGWAIMDGFLAGVDYARAQLSAPEASAVTVERLRMAMIEAFFGVDCTNLASANRALDTAIAALTPTITGGGT